MLNTNELDEYLGIGNVDDVLSDGSEPNFSISKVSNLSVETSEDEYITPKSKHSKKKK